MSQMLAEKLEIARSEANSAKELAIIAGDYPLACKYRDVSERLARLKLDALNQEKPATGVYLSTEQVLKRIKEGDQGKRMNFRDMSNQVLVDLLTKVRHALIGCEEASDTVLDISEILSVNQRIIADNQYEE